MRVEQVRAMLLGTTVRFILFYGSIGVVLAGIAVLVSQPRWLVGKYGGVRFVRLMIPVGIMALGIVGAFWAHAHGCHAIVVTGNDDQLMTEWKRGPLQPDFPLADGAEAAASLLSDPVWVVNNSTAPVFVAAVHYGTTFGASDADPVMVPPGTMLAFHSIDYVGPDDHPPREVTDEYGIGMDVRYWLTWLEPDDEIGAADADADEELP